MPRLRSLPSLVRQADTRTVKIPRTISFERSHKFKEPIYNSREFRQWRSTVLARAGYQCQALINGRRCTKAAPKYRLFADHVHELKDAGPQFDPLNGQCLCFSCHQFKTLAAKKARMDGGSKNLEIAAHFPHRGLP